MPTLEQLEAAMEMLADDNCAFVGQHDSGKPMIYLNMNDTFASATADCQEVPWALVPTLNKIRQEDGWAGLVAYVAGIRGALPIREVRESMSKWDALTQENARLRATLEQYADEKNWNRHNPDYPRDPRDWWQLDGNGYDLAREALKKP